MQQESGGKHEKKNTPHTATRGAMVYHGLLILFLLTWGVCFGKAIRNMEQEFNRLI